MRKMLCIIVAGMLFCGQSALSDQTKSYILRLKDTSAASLESIRELKKTAQVEVLVEDMGIYKVTLPNSRTTSLVLENKSIQYYQEDHEVTLREVTPNDPEFSKLWSFKNPKGNGADVKATEAWSYGTGGKNLDGQDVVVAIVDGGFDMTHNDLKENVWVNKNEIPGNGIDDDNNGYVDDVNGWNSFNDSGLIPARDHATHVAGIVGAKGNNGLNGAGINWNVKLMNISGSSGQTSVVVKAYGYILKQKKLWLETKGQSGANVVATNSSFGVDRASCESGSFPVWNDLYNEMGKVGILSAAATANAAWDIDIVGDVPTGCSSDYLVSVTNTTSVDKINSGAGWGKQTVDIGAPGTDIYSTLPGQGLVAMTGTSMATPHIAGAVAFLYSVASPQLSEIIRNNPAKGALVIKGILLTSVDEIADLKGKTVSSGRLNLQKATEKAYNYAEAVQKR